ncbi:hypothetical protein EMIHUDRAFT_196571 [Emiliania huxleyi CCMP1516]|uniref:Methyltransferase type 11 domain-containing protein n=2 Tax=Emiliania huxleyi TaxID=2903 RepID=A0A0D3ILQ7_EMIH1|nr:hypothetical protein EMIHUDRAFT_214016 [Emiliania huxleyi CCMP1516]XP_005770790.1 hypothetical protein EMIHUDRAFT_196571 [Emiliania huxleyi CCMP1516]EOD12192.1 hypothetical protein EMIHUDRAFT_214016 [Emiliania huxleyi CCMP1516]EOD18361.1 hypothetical protein EMIHUDRAFT_196571 [Emiliania huxleyi CCMP1516]|eukprot:XP_005764621.1 hypothetical protein EMIHUDRAFT_214016 [Emiliania huxleyi CCMP1516]
MHRRYQLACASGLAAVVCVETRRRSALSDPLPAEYSAASALEWRYSFSRDAVASACPSANLTPLELDDESRACAAARDRTIVHALASGLLRLAGFSQYDRQALLDAPEMHLLSTPMWRALLGEGACGGRALDVGAGCGSITERIAPLFEAIHATEVSEWLAWRLRARGIPTAVAHDPADAHALASAGLPTCGYDAVFALNVLDRVPDVDAFLAALSSLLAPGGRLVEAAGEACIALERSGLRVLRLVRAPYLSQGLSLLGTANRPFVLDDAVFVCKRAERGEREDG